MARGLALECAACLDVLLVRKLAKEEALAAQKERLVRIVEMLVGLLRRFSERADVLREEAPDYLSEHEHESMSMSKSRRKTGEAFPARS
jgi:hypothetical protein